MCTVLLLEVTCFTNFVLLEVILYIIICYIIIYDDVNKMATTVHVVS